MRMLPKVALLTLLCALLCGCQASIDKGLYVGTVGGASSEQLIVKRSLPLGEALVVFQTKDWACSPPAGVKVALSVRSEQRIEVEEEIDVRNLAWSRGLSECHGYGYLRETVDRSTMNETGGVGRLSRGTAFVVDDDKREYTIEANVVFDPAQAQPEAFGQQLRVWVIYNGVAPVGLRTWIETPPGRQ